MPESAEAERVMESMIQQGAKLIFPTSFGHQEPAFNVAKRHPDVYFEHAGGWMMSANFGNYFGNTQAAWYPMGVAAGKMTKTQQAGLRHRGPDRLRGRQRERLRDGRALGQPEGPDDRRGDWRLVRQGQGSRRRERASWTRAATCWRCTSILRPPSSRPPRPAARCPSASSPSRRAPLLPRDGSPAWDSPGPRISLTSQRASSPEPSRRSPSTSASGRGHGHHCPLRARGAARM